MNTPRAPRYFGSIPPLLEVSSFAACRKEKQASATGERENLPENLELLIEDGLRKKITDRVGFSWNPAVSLDTNATHIISRREVFMAPLKFVITSRKMKN
jgi:hypothetical protein